MFQVKIVTALSHYSHDFRIHIGLKLSQVGCIFWFKESKHSCRSSFDTIYLLIYLFLYFLFCFSKVPMKPVNKGACYANQKHRGKTHEKCSGFFYVHYFNNLVHGTYGLTSHPKEEAIMDKCLAWGHKRHDQPGRDSNPHPDATRTWVRCTRPLGHDTSQCCTFLLNIRSHVYFLTEVFIFLLPGLWFDNSEKSWIKWVADLGLPLV